MLLVLFLILYTLVTLCLQVDKGISSEVVRSVLAERANSPCLAARSACKVSCLIVTADPAAKCFVNMLTRPLDFSEK